MRRGRIYSGLIALVAMAAFFMVVPTAFADGGTPMDICTDLQDGKLDGSYTQAQLQAFFSDPTVQGYCGPITVVVTPPVTVTPPTAPPTTPPTTPPVTPPCVETTPGTGTPGTGTPGTGTPGTPGTTPPACAPTTPTTSPTPPTEQPATQPATPAVVAVVKGARHTIATPAAPKPQVAGAQHTVKTPTASAAPLATTKTKGTLPFTGAQLALFTLVGLALVATGLLLRTTARRDGQS